MRSEIKLLAGTQLSDASRSLWGAFDSIEMRCNAVIEAAEPYVFANCYSGPEYQYSTGCSVFFPWTFLAFNLVNQPYSSLQFAIDGSPWREFIQMYTHRTQRPGHTTRVTHRIEPTVEMNAVSVANHRIWDARIWDARIWDARIWDARIWDARIWDARMAGDVPGFFKQFGRFRNFDMDHNSFDRTK
jgi:hypothetical protein